MSLRWLILTGYFTGAAGILAYIIVEQPSAVAIIGLTILIALVPIMLSRLDRAILLLIIMRPLVDIVSTYTVLSYKSVSLNLNSLLAVAVAVWGIMMIIRERVQLKSIPGIWLIAALMLVSLISWFGGINFMTSLSEWLRFNSLFVFYILGYHLCQQNKHYITSILWAVALSAVVPVGLGIYQLFTHGGMSIDGIANRIYGTFGHPNVLAFYMVLVLAAVGMMYLATPQQHHRSLVLPWILAGSGIALLFTYARGPWLGMVTFLAIIGLLKYRRVLFITIVSGLIVFSTLWFSRTMLERTFNIHLTDIPLVSRLVERNEEADSIEWRLRLYQTMLPKVSERPLLGYGLGNFVTLRKQGDLGLYDDPEAHNDYLRLAIEVGLVGVGLYLALYSTWLYVAVTQWLSWPKTAWQKHYLLIAIGLIVAFMQMAVSDNVLQGTALLWSWFLLLGGLLSLHPPIVPASPQGESHQGAIGYHNHS